METDVDSMLVPNVISNDEYLRIPEELREKIKVFVTSKYEEFVVSKAVLVSTKVNHEQKITCLENELAKIQQEHNNDKNQLTKTGQDLHTVESKLKTLENDLQTQQDLVQRLERENSEYRQQRNSALDERDSLQRLWERRAVELERIQEECKSLNLELKAANISKSEAITKYEEVKSLQESLLYKESRFEKERIFLNNTIKTLTDELNKHTSDLNQARRDYMNRLLTLEGQLSTNTEQVQLDFSVLIAIERFQTAERTIEELKTKLNISNEKIEKLSDKLKEQREDEIRLKETYDKELEAQRKMVELYKDKSCSADSKSEELTSGVKQLQQLLQEATQQYGDLETEMNRRIVEHQEELAEKEQIIDRLKKELDDANELLKSAQHENLERTIESMSPAAAAASRMIKSGLTVTQIYSQYVSASDELLLTKEENKRLNHFINTIIEDIEEKAPYLKKQKEDYARTLLQVESAKTNMDAMLAELQKVTDEGNEAKKTASFHARENLRLKAELTDVSKQVCFLLKEVEQARAGFAGLPSNADVAGGEANSSSRIISEKLVTFGNIEELFLNNQKLLALVRELTSKKEDEEKEKDDLDPQELKERLEFYVVQFEEMKATMHNYEKMLEALKRQRNMYRNLYQNQSNSDDIEDTMETSPTKTISLPNSPHPAPDSQIDELQKKLLESEKALKELREETDSYRKERQTNDTMMAEQLESLRADLTRLQNSNCKMLAQLEFSEERFKVQQTNAAIYKKQISALEEKNRSYSDTIVKHETTAVVWYIDMFEWALRTDLEERLVSTQCPIKLVDLGTVGNIMVLLCSD
uniref:Nucleoprotein TPR n=1 Tax=Timema cristinae TaxID=61476 RepID=A0A7R9CTU8_TIMCR|nr:unnamed protein product [Timema cristinae]